MKVNAVFFAQKSKSQFGLENGWSRSLDTFREHSNFEKGLTQAKYLNKNYVTNNDAI